MPSLSRTVFATAAFWIATLPAALSAAAAKLPAILQEVEAKYTKAGTLQAEFSQVNEVAALKTKKTSTGVIMVKRPDKLRWETHKPDMNVLVSDGRHFWFYTPPFDEGEHGQVIERRSSEVNSRLANALLSGAFSVTKDMKIRQESPSKFLLIPKPGTAGTVNRAEIEVNPDKKVIEKVTLEHKGGNRSEITLSKIELGKPLGDEVFAFTPPPNTDKVEQ
jgi:outer membrane lipoprotein carrier protein